MHDPAASRTGSLSLVIAGDDTTPRPPLPRSLTSFIGRAAEVAALTALVEGGDLRLVTVTGPGGSGKTRLAIEVTTRVTGAFAYGATFVSLASLRDPALVPMAIVRELGVPVRADQPIDTLLPSLLRDRPVLLVLDNMEHLLDATPLVSGLLGQCERLVVMATSRSPLALSGEHLFPLSPLDAADARELFVQRAGSHGASLLDVPEQGDGLVDAICARLDRMPLAIELAAARTGALNLATIIQRLDRRLPVLTGGPRDAPERQRTMRDTIAWSYDLLPECDQEASRRLSVFVAGFTLEAAGAVALDGADALDLVESLVARNLLVRTRGRAGALRFAMYETIREFAADQLQHAGEDEAAQLALADWLIGMTEGALPHYDGPEVTRYHDAVEAELGNIRATLEWLIARRDAERAIRLAGAIWRGWMVYFAPMPSPWIERLIEGAAWIERSLALEEEQLPIGHVAEALMGLTRLRTLQGDRSGAREPSQVLLERSQAAGYPYGEWWATWGLARSTLLDGDIGAAAEMATRLVEIAPRMRNPHNHAAMSLSVAGEVAIEQGDLNMAVCAYEDAIVHVRIAGNPVIETMVTLMLGETLRLQGNLAQAARRFARAFELMHATRAFGHEPFPLLRLAGIALAQDRPDHAIRLLGATHVERTGLEVTPEQRSLLGLAVSQARAVPVFGTTHGRSGHPLLLELHARDGQSRVSPERFTAAWEAGQQLSWDEVLALATSIGELEPEQEAPVRSSALAGLSRRELEVLRLLADGSSNRAIAGCLSISGRTVENHVFHICAKLGVDSRTAAAAWAVRNGLA